MFRALTRIRAGLRWIFGTCPLCLSLGRILPYPDAPPTERFYVPCPLCEHFSPHHIYNWQKREEAWDEQDAIDERFDECAQ